MIGYIMKKYKYVVSVGCSFSASDHADTRKTVNPGKTYGDVVSEHFEAKHYNLSRSGGSLLRMNRKTLEWCSKNTDEFEDTLIIIGLTVVNRSEIWSNGLDHWYAHPGHDQEETSKPGLFKIDWPLRERKKWFINFFNDKSEFLLYTNIIIGLQSFLELNNIDHIFFDALEPVDKYWERRCDDKEDKLGYKLLFDNLVSYENWYKHPEYESLIDFIRKTPGMGITKHDIHPGKEAHKYWGECLIEYINEKINI